MVVCRSRRAAPEILQSARRGSRPRRRTVPKRDRFQQSSSGQFFVFDRRAHTVFGIDAEQASSWEIVQIGAESGRIIDPTAFAVAPDGTLRRCRRAERSRAHPDLLARGRPQWRLPPAGPCCAARVVLEQTGPQRHRIAAVQRHVDPDVEPETGALFAGIRSERRRHAHDRNRLRGPVTRTIATYTGVEQRHSAGRSDRRLLLRLPDRRAGVPAARRATAACCSNVTWRAARWIRSVANLPTDVAEAAHRRRRSAAGSLPTVRAAAVDRARPPVDRRSSSPTPTSTTVTATKRATVQLSRLAPCRRTALLREERPPARHVTGPPTSLTPRCRHDD